MRSRGYTVTINNFVQQDMDDMFAMIDATNPDYYIFGFEGVHDLSKVHGHIHLYVHWINARTIGFMRHFTKKHHYEPVADPSAMISYCKGYEKGKLKEPECGENYWFERGIPIANGVNSTGTKVIDSIKQGMSRNEIIETYPSYWMYHKDKVIDFINDLRVSYKTEFYIYMEVSQNNANREIKQLLEQQGTGQEYVYVTNLGELYMCEAYDMVVYDPYISEDPRRANSWVVNGKVVYQYGYKFLDLKARIFVLIGRAKSDKFTYLEYNDFMDDFILQDI